jgi:hypothetical protein
MIAVVLVAVLVTVNGAAMGPIYKGQARSPQAAGAMAIGLACGEVAAVAVFLTLSTVGLARMALLLFGAVAYGGFLLAFGASRPVRWDAGWGELFVLAALVGMPGAILRLAGIRLVHSSQKVEMVGKPWQFSLEGMLAIVTACACFFAALRWMATSGTSGIGVLAEWVVLAASPWLVALCVFLPRYALLAVIGIWVVAGLSSCAGISLAAWLNRPAMGLTSATAVVVCGAILLTLRLAGYMAHLALEIPQAPQKPA